MSLNIAENQNFLENLSNKIGNSLIEPVFKIKTLPAGIFIDRILPVAIISDFQWRGIFN